MLRIDIKTVNGTAVLNCSGRLVFGVEVDTLRGIAKARSEKNIRVDLQLVQKVDAAGLGVMVELQHWATKKHRELTFCNIGASVQRLIALTKLESVLRLEESGEAPIPFEVGQERRAMIA